jgi:hypothetical protein
MLGPEALGAVVPITPMLERLYGSSAMFADEWFLAGDEDHTEEAEEADDAEDSEEVRTAERSLVRRKLVLWMRSSASAKSCGDK